MYSNLAHLVENWVPSHIKDINLDISFPDSHPEWNKSLNNDNISTCYSSVIIFSEINVQFSPKA